MTVWTGLLGGIGLFLLGMQMMTAGLTQAAGSVLRKGLEAATGSRTRAFLVGTLITALVQSSSAMTVASIGFVNAGLVEFGNLVWVIYGTSLGNTMTGWIFALAGAKFSIGTLALPLLGIGMMLRLMFRRRERAAGIGEAVAGFGAFFLGIATLQTAFADLTPQILSLTDLLSGYRWERIVFVLLGIVVTLLTQSSSATIAIVLGAASAGAMAFEQAAALIIGASVGTTSTAFFAAFAATSAARRVAASHIGFNLVAGGVALALLPWLARLCLWLVGGAEHTVPALALFHSLYILIGAAVMVPLSPALVEFLEGRFKNPGRQSTKLRYVDSTLREVPDLALRAIALEFTRILQEHFLLARTRIEGQPLNEAAVTDLVSLGSHIREELSQLSLQSLPSEQIDAITDAIRILIYLNDLSRLTRELPGCPSENIISIAGDGFRRQVCIATTGLQMPLSADIARDYPTDVASSRKAYEEIKSNLLSGMTRGKTSYPESEAAMGYSKTLWDIAVVVQKIQSILLPWLEREELTSSKVNA